MKWSQREGALFIAGDIDQGERERLKEEGKQLKERIAELETKTEKAEVELQKEAMRIPNKTHPDVPVGGEASIGDTFLFFPG